MSKKKKRMRPDDRRDLILKSALELATRGHYTTITRDQIAEHADVSVGLVTRYFGTMPQLKRDVMRAAIRAEALPIIAHGLAIQDPHAQKAPSDLKQRAAALLCS